MSHYFGKRETDYENQQARQHPNGTTSNISRDDAFPYVLWRIRGTAWRYMQAIFQSPQDKSCSKEVAPRMGGDDWRGDTIFRYIRKDSSYSGMELQAG
jgi:hypothetical protein